MRGRTNSVKNHPLEPYESLGLVVTQELKDM